MYKKDILLTNLKIYKYAFEILKISVIHIYEISVYLPMHTDIVYFSFASIPNNSFPLYII
jgi:hypothetical protein